MARQTRGVTPVDTSMERSPSMNSQTYSQTVSPIGSMIATPAAAPEPAYIAAREAGQIITQEVFLEFHGHEHVDLTDLHESSFAQISNSALATVNLFLDRILHNVLANSRSLALENLRTAVKEVLKPRLAAEAIEGADDELFECMDGDEIEAFEDATDGMDGPFDLDLVWKRARLRCMVYTRLGDMEEDDEERYIEAQGLDGFVDGRQTSNNGQVSPPVAIWLTAILEFIGENALIISASSAYRRCEARYGRGIGGKPLHPSVIWVSDGDLEKIALNPQLGRLWRAWRKTIKSPRSSISRALSIESMHHRRVDSRSSAGLVRKTSNETLSSVREPQHENDGHYSNELMRKDSLVEEPEVPNSEQDFATAREQPRSAGNAMEEVQEDEETLPELEPEDIPLPMSEYDVDEIEVPGYMHVLDLEGRKDDIPTSKRPTSLAYPGVSVPNNESETVFTRGPRHMRSQSLPGMRLAYAPFSSDEGRPNVAEVLESAQTSIAPRSTEQRPLSDASEGVFRSLKSPSDYQTTDQESTGTTIREKRRSRANRNSFVPTGHRKSAVSELDGSEGPALFDRSDYRVDPNESQTIEAAMMTPQVTAATPTDIPGTPVAGQVRSGLRSNRPVSLAISSPNKLAAPRRTATGEVSPVGEGEYLDSGEVSPLEASDDEGSVTSIPGLKDAQEHMSTEPPEDSIPDSGPYEDAIEEQAAYFTPPVSQTRRNVAPAAAAVAVAATAVAAGTATNVRHSKQDEPMRRQASDESKRDTSIISPRRSGESDKAQPSIPREEQINKLAAAAWVHGNVANPKPERLYRSMSEEIALEEPVVAPSVKSPGTLQTSPMPTSTTIKRSSPPPQVSAPISNSSMAASAAPSTRIHRKEVSADKSHTQSFGGVTPLQLQQNNATDMATPPPASKLLERRRQLPQVDTAVTPERAGVQRLTASPHSADGGLKQQPPRSIPDQIYATPVPPVPAPRESTPPAGRMTASRKASRSGEEGFGHKASSSKSIVSNNEKSKDFEQLIDSGETIQYTLTPQNIRSYKVEAAPESVPMQTSNSRDRPRGLSITSGFGGKSKSKDQVATVGSTTTNSKPVSAGIPVRRPLEATSSVFVSPRSTKSGLAPREAKTDMSSMRDFADFMRSTGPDGSDFDSAPRKIVRAPQPVRSTEIKAKPQTAELPSGMRSPKVGLGGSKRKGPKLQARDPQTNDNSASDLIDFIREGPPTESGAHRIPRTVAPFRNTQDSDDMRNGLSSHPTTNGHARYTNSLNSTQESFKTASQISTSNSHTGLLSNTRANGNANSMGGVQEEPMMPARKSRKPRDPYAIDLSDEEDEYGEDQLDTPRDNGYNGRDESLAEFLQSQAPPRATESVSKPVVGAGGAKVSSLGRPIGNGPGMARPKQQARMAVVGSRSETNDLADFFRNTPPPGVRVGGLMRDQQLGGGVKEKKGGIGGIFRRARG